MKKSNLFISLIGSIGMVSTVIPALVSCSAKEITLTFDAGEHGRIVIPNTNNDTCIYNTNNKTKWVDMLDKPQAVWGTEGAHEFQCWAVDGKPVQDEDIFNEDTTLVAVYSQEHKWDGFEVEDNHLYKTCSLCGERERLTDKELAEHKDKGHFLYTLNSNLVLEDNQSITQVINSYQGDSVDIYLFGGTYEIGGDRNPENPLAVNLNGLLDNNNNLISHVDCFNNNAPEDWQDKCYYCYGINLNCRYLYMDGGNPKETEERTFYCGIQAFSIDYIHCYFTGVQSTYTLAPTFEYCTFDATENGVSEDDAEYSIYIRSTSSASFTNCTFKDVGKAAKIYTDGQIKGATNYVFTDCSFECVNPIDMKACVCIDSQFQTEDTKFQVHMINCTNVKGSHTWSSKAKNVFKENEVPMAEDSSYYSEVYWN